MGYSYGYSDFPKMCFNGAKLWQLGWLSDSEKATWNLGDSTTIPQTYTLYGNPRGNGDGSKLHILKLNTSGSTDYYIKFNDRIGFNSQTIEAGNQVTVVTQGGEGDALSTSSLQAKLGVNQSYDISNFGGSGVTVSVTVNSIDTSAGEASVTITEGGGAPNPNPAPSPSGQCASCQNRDPSERDLACCADPRCLDGPSPGACYFTRGSCYWCP